MTQATALKILKSGANVFLTGEPGSGKSYTINAFRKYLAEAGIPYAVTASTGIAATHIGGVTIHSWSGLGIKDTIDDAFLMNIANNKPFVVKKIQHPQVLIIDEISMLNAQTLDNVERIVSYMRGGSAWGGLQIVFVGDFFQLPPVNKTKDPTKFAFESATWHKANLTYCYLHEQHRQNDPVFLEILTAIRQCEVTSEHKDILRGAFKGDPKSIPTRLFTHNADVDALNGQKLRMLEGETHTFVMEESGNEFLVAMMKKHCLSPEKLQLKEGAVVMFTRNKFGEDEQAPIYVNGTLGVVERFNQGTPVIRTTDGRLIYAEQATWEIEENGVVKASISQYPLRLAWAVTIHKSQGMSLDHARIDLSKAFEYGQGYVAVSRVRSMEGLCIEGLNEHAFEMHPKVIEADNLFREESDLAESKY